MIYNFYYLKDDKFKKLFKLGIKYNKDGKSQIIIDKLDKFIYLLNKAKDASETKVASRTNRKATAANLNKRKSMMLNNR